MFKNLNRNDYPGTKDPVQLSIVSNARRRRLTPYMHSGLGMSVIELSKIFGVSRQTIELDLKGVSESSGES